MIRVLLIPRTIVVYFGAVFLLAIAMGGAVGQASDLFTGFQTNSKDPVQIDAASNSTASYAITGNTFANAHLIPINYNHNS